MIPINKYASIDKPWLRYYSEDQINGTLPESTLYDYLWENNKDDLNDTALIYINEKISYKELFSRIEECAKAFVALGVKPKDIVTVALPSMPEALYCLYALNRLGAVCNMIHPLAGENELVAYLKEVKSRVAVIYSGTYDLLKKSLDRTNLERLVVCSAAESLSFPYKQLYKLKNKLGIDKNDRRLLTWPQFLSGGVGATVPEYHKDPYTMAVISHTGGTTGEPKGVMCSDKGLNSEIWMIGSNLPHVRQEIFMSVLPPFVNYSLVNSQLEPLAFGFKAVLIPDYKPEKFAEYIKKYHPNYINSIPPYWQALLKINEMKTTDLSCLKRVYYGGEGMAPEMEEKINSLLLSRGAHHPLAKGYGSTEMVSAATMTYDECNDPGCCGIPLVKVNCKIVDPETNQEMPLNKEGEICLTGETLMLGYYNNQEATDDIIHVHDDGCRWLHTGDLGYVNDDGLLFVSGRIKRIVMTKGSDGMVTKFFPDRIEKVISKHEAVDTVCVVAVPHETRIAVPIAYVQLKNDVAASQRITTEILDLCKMDLAGYMVPEVVEYVKEFPRTNRGKVDYRSLEKLAKLRTLSQKKESR